MSTRAPNRNKEEHRPRPKSRGARAPRVFVRATEAARLADVNVTTIRAVTGTDLHPVIRKGVRHYDKAEVLSSPRLAQARARRLAKKPSPPRNEAKVARARELYARPEVPLAAICAELGICRDTLRQYVPPELRSRRHHPSLLTRRQAESLAGISERNLLRYSGRELPRAIRDGRLFYERDDVLAFAKAYAAGLLAKPRRKLDEGKLAEARRLLEHDRLPVAEVARRVGVTTSTIYAHLPRTSEVRAPRPRVSRAAIARARKLVAESKRSVPEIARLLGISTAVVYRRTADLRASRSIRPETVARARELLADPHMSIVTVARMLGVSETSIRNYLPGIRRKA